MKDCVVIIRNSENAIDVKIIKNKLKDWGLKLDTIINLPECLIFKFPAALESDLSILETVIKPSILNYHTYE